MRVLGPPRGQRRPLTVVDDQPVLPGQAQLLLPLPHDLLRFGRKAVGVAGKHEGVAVSAGTVEVQEAAGVLHGVRVVVRVDDPVVIVCKPESRGANASPSAGSGVGETPGSRNGRLPETGFISLGNRRLQRILMASIKLEGQERTLFSFTEKNPGVGAGGGDLIHFSDSLSP